MADVFGDTSAQELLRQFHEFLDQDVRSLWGLCVWGSGGSGGAGPGGILVGCGRGPSM